MAWVTSENSRGVERLLDEPNPAAHMQFKTLGPAATRVLLRYQVSEQNRFLFETWDTTQMILGCFFFFFLLFGTREDKFALFMALLMLVAVLFQRFLITPEINSLGRNLDFVPPEVYFPGRPKLAVAQTAYFGLDLCKGLLALVLASRWVLGRRGRSAGNVREELDLVNKANYRHVDR